MSKTQAKAGALDKPQISKEQQEENIKKLLMTQRQSVAQMCLANLCQNPSATIDVPLVEKAFALAEEFVRKAYGVNCEFVAADAEQ